MAPKKQKLATSSISPLFKSENANNTKRNPNRGVVHDEFDDEWQDPLSWMVKQVGELQKVDLRRSKGEQYAIIVQDQTPEDNESNNSVSWVNRIFNTEQTLFIDAPENAEGSEKEDAPDLKTFKCYFPDGPDQCLPPVQSYMKKDDESLENDPFMHERIGRISTFTAKSSNINPSIGDGVYVDFGNRENFDNGIITERISNGAPAGGEEIKGSFGSLAATFAEKRRVSLNCFASPPTTPNIPAPKKLNTSQFIGKNKAEFEAQRKKWNEEAKKAGVSTNKYSEAYLRFFAGKAGITGNELNMLLAQSNWETGNFTIKEEGGPDGKDVHESNKRYTGPEFKRYECKWTKENYPDNAGLHKKTCVDLGNINDGDGMLFRGRGGLQATGRTRYGELSKAMGLGDLLLKEPTLLKDPYYSVISALATWKLHGQAFRTAASKGEIGPVTKRINGGWNHIAQRLDRYTKYCKEGCELILPKNTNKRAGIIEPTKNRFCNINK